jgi:hypothetical protein
MATIGDLVKRALQKLLCEEDVSQFSTAEVAHGLDAANALLDSWSLERLKQYKTVLSSFTTANGTASYTIGTGQTWDTSQPIEIENAYVRADDNDYFVEPIKRREYLKIANKTKSGRPIKLYFERGDSAGTVYLWPVPTAAETIWLDMRKGIATYAAVGDTVTLPSGYERALVWNLALELAPDYETEPSEMIKQMAAQSLAAIFDINSPVSMTGLQQNAPQDRGRVMDLERG